MLKPSSLAVATLVLTGASLAWTVWSGGAPRAEASSLATFADTDDDMLPDCVEWVLMTDPQSPDTDGDGSPDFFDATAFAQRDPQIQSDRSDHSARFVAVSNVDAHGQRRIWLFVLAHIVGDDLSAVQSLNVFLRAQQSQISLNPLLGLGQVFARTVTDPERSDTIAVFAFELLDETVTNWFAPFYLGASIQIDGASYSNEVALFRSDDATCTLVSDGDDGFVAQTIGGLDPITIFWSNHQICTFDLVPITANDYIVVEGECKTADSFFCPPGCASLSGRMFHFPNGLASITGR